MIQLDPAVNGRIKIAGQPHQRGLLRVTYSLSATVTVRDPWGPVFENVHYGQLINGSTGQPFGSLAELRSFVDANCYRVRTGGTPPASDADADAYIAAAGLTDPNHIQASKTFITGWKSAGLWAKTVNMLPMIGGTATSHRVCMRNPAQLASWYGSPGHSANGVAFNGANSYGNTGVAPSALAGFTTGHAYLFYSRSAGEAGPGWSLGVGNTANGNPLFGLATRRSGNLALYDFGNISGGSGGNSRLSFASTNGSGLFSGNTSGTIRTIYRNGSVVATSTVLDTSDVPTQPIWLGAANPTAGQFYGLAQECAFYALTGGLSAPEHSQAYSLIQTLQTALSRQI